MAQKTIVANARATISANGTSTANGNITWSVPALPNGVTSWDNIVISGMWSWNGKGSISRVVINGVNTSNGVQFNVNITGKTQPLAISCVGNKNATGSNFSWSNLIVTYTYTEISTGPVLKIKSNGELVDISKVYRKVSGVLVEETDLTSIFDSNINYLKIT